MLRITSAEWTPCVTTYTADLAEMSRLVEIVNLEHIQRARLRIDVRKWYVSKLAPRKYVDRLVGEHTGPSGGPLLKAPVDLDQVRDDLCEIFRAAAEEVGRNGPSGREGAK
jgi:hypothetical protein